jgi:phosphohistidine phosphatase
MKKLTLIRHAKSDWDNDLSDFDRPLNSRGKKEAPIMAKYVKDNLPKVDLIISSPATRAEETAIAFAKENDYPIDKIIFADELYLCSISEYIEILEQIIFL